ncbi:MAG: transglutaminase-like domain-containing protein [Methanobacteriota archaeon]
MRGLESTPPVRYEEPPRKKRSVAGIIAVAAVLIIALLLVASPWFWAFMGDLGETRAYDEGAKLTVKRTIDFSVSGQGVVDYELDIPLPKNLVDSDSAYVQRSTKTDPAPTPLDEYKYGQHWMVWDGSDAASKKFVIDYEFEVSTIIWNIAPSDSADVSAIPQDMMDRYNGVEWKIDPTLPEVASLSNELTRLDDNVRDKLRSIYDHMKDNLVYETGRDGLPKSCLETLHEGAGDCDDQSILFCSLARAAGIPAWMEFGALYDSGQDIWGGHAWAKAYVPLANGGGGAVCIDVVNREFFVRACNRFSDWESDGNGTHMEDYYNTLSYTSVHSVQLEYSETYEGSYEATGGKVSARMESSIRPGMAQEFIAAKPSVRASAGVQSDLKSPARAS